MLTPLHYDEFDWDAEEFSGGCYVSLLGTGALTQFGAALRGACGAVHWGGTETSEVWSGYVEGALHAGRERAREIIASLK